MNKIVSLGYVVSAKGIKMVKKLQESVQHQIQKKNEQYTFKANKGCKRVIFEFDD
jgi:hypothetical protein